MSTMSKLSYLKRYMSKEDLQDFKMKNKVKKKLMDDLEKRKAGEETGQSPVGASSSSSSLKKTKLSQAPSSLIHRKPAQSKKRHDSDSDGTPPRRQMAGAPRKLRHDSDSDQSPPRNQTTETSRKSRHDSDSDQSPCRKTASDPLKNVRNDPDSDQSPPRKSSKMASDSDQSPPRKSSKMASDSDQSPPRKSSKVAPDSDQSPPRRATRKRHDSDSDQSPPRQHRKSSPPRTSGSRRGDRPSRFSNLSPPRGKTGTSAKATKTMSGATAGLSSAAEMKREARILRDKEEKSFQKINDEILGRNAKTIMRDRETGKRRNLQAEKEEDAEKEKRLEEQKAKYEKWGKGLSQQQERDRVLAEQVHEASKPLARYKDDKDLDEMLRNEQRAEDPMLAFIQRKKDKQEAKSGKVKAKKELPKYKGPTPPPPNRFNILPGYRWDGVDRSNGFENKIFANINNKKAVQEMAYKWSTEDM